MNPPRPPTLNPDRHTPGPGRGVRGLMQVRAGRAILLALLGVCAGAGGRAEVITVPALGPRFKQTRERIADLFQNRNGTYPVPDPRQNPFRTGTDPVGESTPTATAVPAAALSPDSDAAILRQGIATIKVGGWLVNRGVPYVTINQRSYKEGDVILVRVQAKAVYLRVKGITQNTVTLTLNEAELTLRF